jgi:hypothetical protein
MASGGALVIATGVAAIGFASRSMSRVRAEQKIITTMIEAKTTVRGLAQQAAKGEPLPKTVLLHGWLKARGGPVQSIAMQCQQLRPLVRQIDQPRDVNMTNIVDDFSKRIAVMERNLVLSELFITRLSCEATILEVNDSEASNRDPRATRFNVLHHRQASDGLHVVDDSGAAADVVLPDFTKEQLERGESPPSLLSLPEVLNEFKRSWLGGEEVGRRERMHDVHALPPFSHLSKFIHLDKTSDTDNGEFGGSSGGESSLEELGRLIPNDWLWAGKGFYDNRPGSWSSYPGSDFVSYRTFAKRLVVAAEENSQY